MESEQQFQFVNNWTRIAGNHTIKFGADIRRALETDLLERDYYTHWQGVKKQFRPG